MTLCDPWTVAYQAPPSVGFPRQECRSGLPFPSPGDLPDPGIAPGSPTLQADALPSEPAGKPQYRRMYIMCALCTVHMQFIDKTGEVALRASRVFMFMYQF